MSRRFVPEASCPNLDPNADPDADPNPDPILNPDSNRNPNNANPLGGAGAKGISMLVIERSESVEITLTLTLTLPLTLPLTTR